MKKFKILALTLFFASFLFNACQDTTTNPIDNNGPVPNPPTNLMATSKTETSVLVKWAPSSSESDANFAGYVLNVTGGTPMAPIALTKSQNPYEVQGLEEGVVYTFSLQAKFSSDSLSTKATVQWSPAHRFIDNANDNPIRIYETASALGSGLVLSNTDKPSSAKVANGDTWVLGLYTKSGEISLGSPKLLSYNYGVTPNTVEIADVLTNVSSLDEIYGSQALSASNFSEKKIDLTQYSASIALVIRYHQSGSSKWTYAKVFVIYKDGSFLQGTADNRYVQFYVSQQNVEDVPYAKVATKASNNIVK